MKIKLTFISTGNRYENIGSIWKSTKISSILFLKYASTIFNNILGSSHSVDLIAAKFL